MVQVTRFENQEILRVQTQKRRKEKRRKEKKRKEKRREDKHKEKKRKEKERNYKKKRISFFFTCFDISFDTLSLL